MPNRGEVGDQHDVAFRVCEMLFYLSDPVQCRQRSREIDRLRISTTAPNRVPNENGEVRDADPLVAQKQSRVVVEEERGFGGGSSAVGHENTSEQDEARLSRT